MKVHSLPVLRTWVLALAGALTVVSPAFADDDRRGRHGGHSSHHRDDDRGDRRHGRWDNDDRRRHWDDDRRSRGHSRWDRSDPRRVVYMGPSAPRYVVRHHPVYHDRYRGRPPWARGRHYGYHGYGPTYVVHDYRPYRHRLYAPPRGYYWRRSDAGEFLLVAIATGIIADIVLNH